MVYETGSTLVLGRPPYVGWRRGERWPLLPLDPDAMNCVYPDETIGCHGGKRTRQLCRAQQVIGMTRRLKGHDQLTRSF